jgi:hypothetical protein
MSSFSFPLSTLTTYRTKYRELGYTRLDASTWQFVSLEDGAQVGRHYPSRASLMADLENYASMYGCDGAEPYGVKVLASEVAPVLRALLVGIRPFTQDDFEGRPWLSDALELMQKLERLV